MIADRPTVYVDLTGKRLRAAILVDHDQLERPRTALRVVRNDAYEETISMGGCLGKKQEVPKGRASHLHVGLVDHVWQNLIDLYQVGLVLDRLRHVYGHSDDRSHIHTSVSHQP